MPDNRMPTVTDDLLHLFPIPTQAVSLLGCYLAHKLHQRGQNGRPFVYTNFITSLDGRIALAASGRDTHQVPPAIANPRDWRLYQELGAQADVLITTARYLRQLAIGEAQDMLPVGDSPDFEDLRRWRLAQGLQPQPDVAVLSASLDIPPETLTGLGDRRLYVITGESADGDRIAALRDHGIDVRLAGSGHGADGHRLIQTLAEEGYRSIYAIGGPSVMHTLAADGVLDRLYLTHAHVVLGGEDFDTFAWGSELSPALALQMGGLYYDPVAPAGAGQLMAYYDCQVREDLMFPLPDPHAAR